MKIQTKLSLFAALTLISIVLFCFIWLESVPIQLGLLLGNTLLMLIRFGGKKLFSEMLLLTPFLLMVTLIYGIFAFFRIAYPAGYWIAFGLTRSALIVSSMFYMQLLLSFVSMEEIQELPLKIGTMKYIILGNLLYKEALGSFAEIGLYMELMPSEQLLKRSFYNKIRFQLGCLLALLGYILSLATLKGKKIDEHIAHCHQGDTK